MLEIQQARILMRQIVNEQGPNFRYVPAGNSHRIGCFYVPLHKVHGWADRGLLMRSMIGESGKPDDPRYLTACLIGRVLETAGETRHMTPETLGKNVRGLKGLWPDMMSWEAEEYLQSAQLTQDRGGTWGEALEAAEKRANSWPHLASL